MGQIGRSLVVVGAILLLIGALLMVGERLPFRLGRLPGDIEIKAKGGSFYFPLMTCLVISALLSLISWVAGRLR
jgi:hypothetical protein